MFELCFNRLKLCRDQWLTPKSTAGVLGSPQLLPCAVALVQCLQIWSWRAAALVGHGHDGRMSVGDVVGLTNPLFEELLKYLGVADDRSNAVSYPTAIQKGAQQVSNKRLLEGWDLLYPRKWPIWQRFTWHEKMCTSSKAVYFSAAFV